MRMEHARLPNLTRCQILESCDPISLPSRSKYHFSREYLFLMTSNWINRGIFRKSLIIVYSLFISLFLIRGCFPKSFLWSPFFASWSKYHFFREYLLLTTCSNWINRRIFRKSLIIVYSLFLSLFLIRGCFPNSFLWSPFFAAWSKNHFSKEYLFGITYSN